MTGRLARALAIVLLTSSLALQAQQPQMPTELPMPQTLPDAGAVQSPSLEQRGYTLAQLTELTLDYNPILRRDLARVEEARGTALQAGLWNNPRFDTNNPQVFYGRTILPNVGFQQEIPVKGKKRLDAAAAEQRVREADLAYRQDRYDLLTAVRQQFYTTLAAQRRLEVLTQLEQILKTSLETGQKLKQAHEAGQIDVLLLRIDYQQAQVNMQNARAILQGQQRQLSAIVGLPQLGAIAALGDLSTKLPDFDEEIARRFVVSDHTAVRNADAEVVRTKIVLERARAEPYPNPYMGPAYQFGNIAGASQFWFNIQFDVPVWNRNQGNILNASANVRDALESRIVTQNGLLQQVADVFSRYRAARELADQYEQKIIPDTVTTMRMAQQAYARGVFDFPRFLQAQRTMVETNSRYVDILENVWRTAAETAGLLQMDHFP